MGRPLSKTNFGDGTGALAIKFHNGTTVVKGYVVKQLGTITYRVSDGTVEKDVTLAQTRDEALNLTGDLATFEVFVESGTDYVKKLTYCQAYTVSGNSVLWGNAMTQALPEWIVALRAPNGDYPVAVSDFENGRYFFGGAEHTFEETWDSAHYGDFGLTPATDIVPGVGITHTGTASYDMIGAVATPEFFEAMGFASGSITCMVDAVLSQTDPAGRSPQYTIACVSDYNSFNDGWEFGYAYGGTADTFYDNDTPEGPFYGGEALSGAQFMGPRRDVAQFTPTNLYYTDDGSEAVSTTNTVDGTHFEAMLLQLGLGGNQTAKPGQATATIRKIVFYPLLPVADLNDLPA